MTGPNPDAELDEALGITELPPAAITDNDRSVAHAVVTALRHPTMLTHPQQVEKVAQAIADAGRDAVARYIAEHKAAGT